MFDRYAGQVIAEGMRNALQRRRQAESKAIQRAADREVEELLEKSADTTNRLNDLCLELIELINTDFKNIKTWQRRASHIIELSEQETAKSLPVREKRLLNLHAVARMELETFCSFWDLDFQIWLYTKMGKGQDTGQFDPPTDQETSEAFKLNSLYVKLKCLSGETIPDTRDAWVKARAEEYIAMNLSYSDTTATVPDDDRFGRLPSARFYDLLPAGERPHYHLNTSSKLNVLTISSIMKSQLV